MNFTYTESLCLFSPVSGSFWQYKVQYLATLLNEEISLFYGIPLYLSVIYLSREKALWGVGAVMGNRKEWVWSFF